MKRHQKGKSEVAGNSYSWEKIAIFLCFVLPALILYFIEVTNTVLILYLGGVTGVSAIAYSLITQTSIGALGISYRIKAISSIIPRTLVIAAVTVFALAVVPWIIRFPRTICWQIDPFLYLSIVVY